MKKKGKLIIFEGIDGSGKSSQANFLAEYLRQSGFPVWQDSEPTKNHYGLQLRYSMKNGRFSPQRENELFLLDRQDHVENHINPRMKNGQFVILDRYFYSNYAYQGIRGFEPDEILAKNRSFAPEPDIFILLDLDEKTALKRLCTRDGSISGNEFEKIDDLKRVRKLFLAIKHKNLIKIDASKKPMQIHQQICQKIEKNFLNNMF